MGEWDMDNKSPVFGRSMTLSPTLIAHQDPDGSQPPPAPDSGRQYESRKVAFEDKFRAAGEGWGLKQLGTNTRS
jgi:hypothetical protein